MIRPNDNLNFVEDKSYDAAAISGNDMCREPPGFDNAAAKQGCAYALSFEGHVRTTWWLTCVVASWVLPCELYDSPRERRRVWLHVVVDAEEIGRVVLVLDFDESRVVGPERRSDDVLGLVA